MNDPVALRRVLALIAIESCLNEAHGSVPELNDGDLVSMGIVLGHRKQLLRAMAQLSHRREGETATLAIPHRDHLVLFQSRSSRTSAIDDYVL